jgi:hypothetical protein
MRPRDRLSIRRTMLLPGDVDRVDGLPVTSALRTTFDLARHVGRIDAVVAVDAMCHNLVRFDELAAFAEARASWPGSRRLREALILAEPLSESPMETRARLVLGDAGAPPLTPQYEVRDSDGSLLGRVDLAYPELRIAIEYEGDHHRQRGQFQRDIARLNRLQEAGWMILRFTADDVLRHPDRLVRQVATAVRARR